jgi:hypothetical protein
LSDFLRTLVVSAAAATWLGLESGESLERLRNLAELGQISEAIGKMIPAARRKRPYAPRRPQGSDVVSLILPAGLAHLIEYYAKAHRFSKNDLCGSLLIKGLVIYMTCEKNLLQAMGPLDDSSDCAVA